MILPRLLPDCEAHGAYLYHQCDYEALLASMGTAWTRRSWLRYSVLLTDITGSWD
jgi:hypothetical protein